MIATTIIVLVLLLLVNALFVAAEFAAVGARAHRITDHAHPRSRRVKILLSVLEDPAYLDRYVSACQLGITITSLALGAVAEASLSGQLAPLLIGLGGMQDAAAHSVAVVIVLIGLSFIQMVVAEQTPKSLALQHPNSVAVSTVLPVAWALRLLGGLVRVLNGLSQMILRVFGVSAATGHHLYSAEEIGMLITEVAPNDLEEKERERLRQALEFFQGGDFTRRREHVTVNARHRIGAGEAGHIYRRLGRSRPPQRAPGMDPHGKDVSGTHQI